MDKATIKDLKQFIVTTVEQKTAGLASKDDIASIIARLDENDLKQDEILNVIGEAMDRHDKALLSQASHIDDHERRILKLEKRTV